jgi:hypothetical protein
LPLVIDAKSYSSHKVRKPETNKHTMTKANKYSDDDISIIYKSLLTQGALSSLATLNHAVEHHSKFTESQNKRQQTMFLTAANPNAPSRAAFKRRLVAVSKENGKLRARTSLPKQFTSREELLAFVRIVFAYLEHSHDNMLRERARTVIFNCVRRHRVGNPKYRNLQFAVVRDLRPLVGEAYWADAKYYLRSYYARRAIRPPTVSVL